MADPGSGERALIDALDEPAFVVDGSIVGPANRQALALLGSGMEGRDVRIAIRHPQALEPILAHRSGEVDVSGIVEPGRSWRLVIRALRPQAVLVRMIDRSAAVSAEKMRVDFVANASHELRTPLATIIGYAETLADEGDLSPETTAAFGRTVRDEAARMLRIIEDLMSLSRIEADRFVAPEDSVSVAEIVDLAVANAAHASDSAGCELVVQLSPGLPPVRGDRTQLLQLLDNLLGNAIRYGCDRPDSEIEIGASHEGAWVTLTVGDQGPGIPRDHLLRITERFYRVDDARSRQSGGTGLGLAIVKHIVERHRGTLDIISTVGVGTKVTVRLPIKA